MIAEEVSDFGGVSSLSVQTMHAQLILHKKDKGVRWPLS